MNTYTGGTPRAEDWRDFAACAGEDPELFFPNGTEGGWKQIIFDAKDVCARCPVSGDCLTFALNEGIDYGVYGGLTDNERRKLRRRAARQITAADVDEVREPTSIKEAFERRSVRVDGGHEHWTGNKQLLFSGVYYTPRRAAFLIGQGTAAYGHVIPKCGDGDCVRPSHMEDAKGRDARKRAAKRTADQQKADGRPASRRQAAA